MEQLTIAGDADQGLAGIDGDSHGAWPPQSERVRGQQQRIKEACALPAVNAAARFAAPACTNGRRWADDRTVSEQSAGGGVDSATVGRAIAGSNCG